MRVRLAAIIFCATATSALACGPAATSADDASLRWRAPLDGRADTDGLFGVRRHPVLGVERLHAGIDWSRPIGTPVQAALAGRVRRAERTGEFGLMVSIDHGHGVETIYAHLSKIDAAIQPDACVVTGQSLGAVGNTGLSTTPHLHFEYRRNGAAVDPAAYAHDSSGARP